MEEQAGVRRHRQRFGMPARWTVERGHEGAVRHGFGEGRGADVGTADRYDVLRLAQQRPQHALPLAQPQVQQGQSQQQASAPCSSFMIMGTSRESGPSSLGTPARGAREWLDIACVVVKRSEDRAIHQLNRSAIRPAGLVALRYQTSEGSPERTELADAFVDITDFSDGYVTCLKTGAGLSGRAQANQLLHLSEREAERLRVLDEPYQPGGFWWKLAVPARAAARRLQQATPFVVAQRVGTHTGKGRQVANSECLRVAASVNRRGPGRRLQLRAEQGSM